MNLISPKLIIYFLASMFISFFFIKILIKYSRSLHLIDTPNYRKFHERETPLVGGLGIILTLFIIFFVSWIFKWHLIYLPLNEIILIIIGSIIIILLFGMEVNIPSSLSCVKTSQSRIAINGTPKNSSSPIVDEPHRDIAISAFNNNSIITPLKW